MRLPKIEYECTGNLAHKVHSDAAKALLDAWAKGKELDGIPVAEVFGNKYPVELVIINHRDDIRWAGTQEAGHRLGFALVTKKPKVTKPISEVALDVAKKIIKPKAAAKPKK